MNFSCYQHFVDRNISRRLNYSNLQNLNQNKKKQKRVIKEDNNKARQIIDIYRFIYPFKRKLKLQV